jgi:site-specific recombinase XerD
MDRFFSRPRTLLRMREGPLGFCIDSYAALLHELGYTRESARLQIRLVSDFSRWLSRNRCGPTDITPERCVAYLRYRARHLRSSGGETAALDRLINLLRKTGLVAAPIPPEIRNPCEDILSDFKIHLSQERVLSPATLKNYVPFARLLLTERFADNQIKLSQLRATDITGFVQRHALCSSRKRALLMTTALRSFLRFLYQRGNLHTNLAGCVPTVPSWSLGDVPQYIQPEQVQHILDLCDRKTAGGQRDYAILLLLARLGLRAGEVAFLKLEDIDWEAGHITIHGKGGRSDLFPITVEIGQAVTDYLQNVRPRCSNRCVFVRMAAPQVGFASHTAISSIVRRALARARIRPPHKGAHLLRHTLATQMLQEGANLAEIGDILRHRHPNTTLVYAKVDLNGLRTIALPWPGGER